MAHSQPVLHPVREIEILISSLRWNSGPFYVYLEQFPLGHHFAKYIWWPQHRTSATRVAKFADWKRSSRRGRPSRKCYTTWVAMLWLADRTLRGTYHLTEQIWPDYFVLKKRVTVWI